VNSPEEADSNSDNIYTTRLAEVNEKNAVVASEDIVNDQGALLIKKGSVIDKSAQEKIVQFKLLNPIDSSVALENELSDKNIVKLIQTSLIQHPELESLHETLGLDMYLRMSCKAYFEIPLLRQKITVLELQLPDRFSHSLLTSWFALLIAHQTRMSIPDTQMTFLAALSMEVGYLHLDNEIEEGIDKHKIPKNTQAHPVIGCKILRSIEDLDPRIPRAVLEHHERCDGTGYPKSKFHEELGLEGQIVGMSDLISERLAVNIKEDKMSLANLLPMLQVNALVHRYDVYEVTIKALRTVVDSTNTHIKLEDLDPVITELLNQNAFLSSWVNTLEQMIEPYVNEKEHAKLQAIKQAYINVLGVVRGAGLLDEGYLRWLELVRKEKLEHALREIEDTLLMMEEITIHLERITYMFRSLTQVSDKSNTLDIQPIEKGLVMIDALTGKSL